VVVAQASVPTESCAAKKVGSMEASKVEDAYGASKKWKGYPCSLEQLKKVYHLNKGKQSTERRVNS